MGGRARPRLDLALQAALLMMSGLVAAGGVSLGCFVRNLIQAPQAFFPSASDLEQAHGRLRGFRLEDGVMPAVMALVLVVWVIALIRFVAADPRSPIRLAGGGLSLAIFGWAAFETWRMAWPVCNPM